MKDKEEENAVLWARIKIFEDRQNQEILDRYFPKADGSSKPTSNPSATASATASSTASTPASSEPLKVPPCCLPPPCSSSLPCCPHSRHHHCLCNGPGRTQSSESEIDKLVRNIEKVNHKLQEISDELNVLKAVKSSSTANNERSETVNLASEDITNGEAAQPDESHEPSDPMDHSAASIEEFFPDITGSSSISPPLNLGDPTNQL